MVTHSRTYTLIKIIGAALVGVATIVGGLWPVYQYFSKQKPVPNEAHISSINTANSSDISVVVYWHRDGFNENQARKLAKLFEATGAQTVVDEHRDPRAPDSLFIGHSVGANLARIALLNTPYTIRYLFRPDYSASDGSNSDDGRTIGIGYRSTHFEKYRAPKAEPLKINQEIVNYLTAPGISDADFQKRLKDVTGS